MARKATLLKRAKKLGLKVTDSSTIPEINAALEAHAKKNTPKKVSNSTPSEPQTPEPTSTPPETETPIESVTEPQINMKDILMTYNSVVPSRRRQIQNRNELRNRWKELFQLLERASGRSGQKVEILDYNWHKVIDKGGTPGLGNLERDEVTIVSDDGAAVADNANKDQRILELEAQVESLASELSAVRQANTNAQAQSNLGNELPTTKPLGDGEALPGEKTSTLPENANESSLAKEKGKEVETETSANLEQ